MKPYIIAMLVPNAEETANWYKENLGFEIVKEVDYDDQGLKVKIVELNEFQIEIIENENSVSPAKCVSNYDFAKPTIQGLMKLSFIVEDIEYLVAKLKEKQVEFTMNLTIHKEINAKCCLILDINKNLIQFIEKVN